MSRVEAAAKAHYGSSPHAETWKLAEPDVRQWFLGRIAKGLAAADAYDAAHNVHRVVLSDATVERAARATWVQWDEADEASQREWSEIVRAVLAAAVKEES